MQRGGRGPAPGTELCSCRQRRGPWSRPGPGTGLGGSVTRSHATSRQSRVQRTARGPGQGRQGGRPRAEPPRALIPGPVHELWELQEEDSPTSGAKAGGPPQGRPRRTQEPQRAPPPWERVPPCGQECEQQGQRGDPCCSRPPWGPQSPGSRQDRQPRVQAETVPSTGGGAGAGPRSQGTFLREVPGAEGTGRSGGSRPLPCPLLGVTGSSRKQRAESRAEPRGEAPSPPRPGRHQCFGASTRPLALALPARALPPRRSGGQPRGPPDSSMYKRRTPGRPPRGGGRAARAAVRTPHPPVPRRAKAGGRQASPGRAEDRARVPTTVPESRPRRSLDALLFHVG